MRAPPAQLRAGPQRPRSAVLRAWRGQGHADHVARQSVARARCAGSPATARAYRRLGTVLLEGEHLCAAWLARVPAAGCSTRSSLRRPGTIRRCAGSPTRADEVAVVPSSGARRRRHARIAGDDRLSRRRRRRRPASRRRSAVVLDRIQDPGNVGSVLRSAAAFGFRAGDRAGRHGGAVVAQGRCAPAMGAHFALRLVEACRRDCAGRARACRCSATSSHAARRLDSVALPWPCAWVFGHEGQGIDAGIAARCAAVLAIPQPGGGESLNVAAAAAVCLYETVRQRVP